MRWRLSRSWSEIHRVRFSLLNRWFIIEDGAGTKIRAHIFLRGVPSLVIAFEEKLDPELYCRAVEKYRRIVR